MAQNKTSPVLRHLPFSVIDSPPCAICLFSVIDSLPCVICLFRLLGTRFVLSAKKGADMGNVCTLFCFFCLNLA